MDLSALLAKLEQIPWQSALAPLLRILAILVVTWVVLRVARLALDHLERRLIRRDAAAGGPPAEAEKRADTLVRLLRKGVLIVVWLIVALIILRELGVDIAPILASAGIVGLAVGFGAQNLVRDVISGFFIIMENQIRLGDVAIINGTGGVVEKIDFRITVLRDLHGVVHVFPNGAITSLSNMTQEWSAIVLDIGVAYKEDTDRVAEVMKRVGAEMREDEYFGPLMLEEMEIFGVDQFADSAVIIRGRIKTQPIKQWEVGREYRRRLKKAFDAEGIEIPFPHRSLYVGEASKPMMVELAERARGAPEPTTSAEQQENSG